MPWSRRSFHLTGSARTRHHCPMDERLTEEGIEHLQSAARELISAARIFLDVVEDLVEEPERITNTLSGVVEAFRDIAARPVQPWEAHAWGESAGTGPDGASGRRDATTRRGAGGSGRSDTGRRHRSDEPTLFPLDDDVPEPIDVDSDWAVWDDEETGNPVVDIRRAARRTKGTTADGTSAATTDRRVRGSEEPSSTPRRSTVRRITVD